MTKETNPNTTARIAGTLYLLLAVFGAFSILYVPSVLIVDGDPVTSIRNILESETLFRLGIFGALVTQVVQIATVLYLYKVLKPVDKNQARLMVLFVLLAVPIAMLNELTYAAIPLLLNSSDYVAAFTPAQINTLVPLLLDLHEHGTMIAHIFWGLWLFPMGYLVFRSAYLPKLIGLLLMIGCFGYLTDTLTFFLMPSFGVTVSEYTFVGELLLPLWLVFRGVNVEQWQKRAFVAARA